jgi:hypothetical protein
MAATPTITREHELDALAQELIAAEGITSQEAHAEAEDQLAELMAYADGWDDQTGASSLDPEIHDLADTLMRAEGLTIEDATLEAERRGSSYLHYARCWDNAALDAGNDAALDSAIPF